MFFTKEKHAAWLFLLRDGQCRLFTRLLRITFLLRHVLWVVHLFMCRPQIRTTNSKIFANARLVPEHTILDPVGLDCIVQHETLVIFRASIHHLIEHVEGWEDSEERLVQLFPVLEDILPKKKDVVNVGSKCWR